MKRLIKATTISFKHCNGMECSKSDILDSLAFMYGIGENIIKNKLIAKEFSDDDIQKAIIYYDCFGDFYDEEYKELDQNGRDINKKIREETYQEMLKKFNLSDN